MGLVADWVSQNDDTVRTFPIYIGVASRLVILSNRTLYGIAPVADVSRKFGPLTKEEKSVVDSGERKLVIHQQDGRLRNLLKKTYLKRWINPLDVSRNEVDSDPNGEGKFFPWEI